MEIEKLLPKRSVLSRAAAVFVLELYIESTGKGFNTSYSVWICLDGS